MKFFCAFILTIGMFVLLGLTQFGFESVLAAGKDIDSNSQAAENGKRIIVSYKNKLPEVNRLSAESNKGIIETKLITDNIQTITYDSAADINDVISDLKKNSNVKSVSIDYVVHAFDLSSKAIESKAQASYIKTQTLITDPLYLEQWWMKNIHASSAWENFVPSPTKTVVVAVLDTGCDVKNPEFIGKIADGAKNFSESEEPGITDMDGHGSAVASCIVAKINNIGMSGVAGIYNVKVLPLKVLDDYGSGYVSDFIEAINYAIQHGVDIINMSLGGIEYSQVFQEVCAKANSNGITIIAASGNEALNGNPISYPAGYEGVISVGGIDKYNKRASFSTYNKFVDVCAPGKDILAVTIGEMAQADLNHDGFGLLSGTSFASPIVAGICAMIKLQRPSITLAEIEQVLKQSSDDLGSTGRDDQYGEGSVNLLRAVAGSADFNFTTNGKSAIITGYVGTGSNITIPTILGGYLVIGIDDFAFSWYTGLTSVTIPGTITSIGDFAFYDCQDLTKTYFLGNAPAIGEYVFDNCAPSFTIFYLAEKTGFTVPKWNGYPTAISAKKEILLAAPAGLIAASVNYNSIRLSWKAVAGASGYGIYRSTTALGTYSFLATSNTTSYINIMLATGSVYYYKIKAYRAAGTNRVYGNSSGSVSAKPVPVAPTNLKAASANYNSIRLTWVSVAGSSGYAIYRAKEVAGKYTFLTTATTNSYINTALTTGSMYYYKVKAYRTAGTIKILGYQTAAVSTRPTPTAIGSIIVARYNSTSIKISWSAITGANGYEIFRSSVLSGAYSLIKTTSALYFMNTGLTTGKYDYYKVRAYRLVGTTKIYGAFSAIKYTRP